MGHGGPRPAEVQEGFELQDGRRTAMRPAACILLVPAYDFGVCLPPWLAHYDQET